jgi:hypothetical protein
MKTLLATLFLGFVYLASAQNILLVDNTPSAPSGSHVYSNLQTAVDAASPGDIIHVKPSSTSYGNLTINTSSDSITIYGIGINPDKEIKLNSTIGTVYITGSNIKISGMLITGTVYSSYSSSTANISMENNRFNNSVYTSYSYTSSNVIYRNCIFYHNFYTDASLSNNTVVSNCVFAKVSPSTTSGQVYGENGTLFNHCLFIANGASGRWAFNDLNYCTVSNTIFYGINPSPENSYSNATYNNCYSEQAADNNSFPTDAGNSVNGTIATQAGPIFTDANIVLTNGWTTSWDPTLDPTGASGLVAAGDDGTDVGLTGGTIPWSINGAPLPYIKSLVVPSVIKQGNDLDVTIKANGN